MPGKQGSPTFPAIQRSSTESTSYFVVRDVFDGAVVVIFVATIWPWLFLYVTLTSSPTFRRLRSAAFSASATRASSSPLVSLMATLLAFLSIDTTLPVTWCGMARTPGFSAGAVALGEDLLGDVVSGEVAGDWLVAEGS